MRTAFYIVLSLIAFIATIQFVPSCGPAPELVDVPNTNATVGDVIGE